MRPEILEFLVALENHDRAFVLFLFAIACFGILLIMMSKHRRDVRVEKARHRGFLEASEAAERGKNYRAGLSRDELQVHQRAITDRDAAGPLAIRAAYESFFSAVEGQGWPDADVCEAIFKPLEGCSLETVPSPGILYPIVTPTGDDGENRGVGLSSEPDRAPTPSTPFRR